MNFAGYGVDLGEMEAIMHVKKTNGSDTASVLRFFLSAIRKFDSYARLSHEIDVRRDLLFIYDSKLYGLAQKT